MLPTSARLGVSPDSSCGWQLAPARHPAPSRHRAQLLVAPSVYTPGCAVATHQPHGRPPRPAAAHDRGPAAHSARRSGAGPPSWCCQAGTWPALPAQAHTAPSAAAASCPPPRCPIASALLRLSLGRCHRWRAEHWRRRHAQKDAPNDGPTFSASMRGRQKPAQTPLSVRPVACGVERAAYPCPQRIVQTPAGHRARSPARGGAASPARCARGSPPAPPCPQAPLHRRARRHVRPVASPPRELSQSPCALGRAPRHRRAAPGRPSCGERRLRGHRPLLHRPRSPRGAVAGWIHAATPHQGRPTSQPRPNANRLRAQLQSLSTHPTMLRKPCPLHSWQWTGPVLGASALPSSTRPSLPHIRTAPRAAASTVPAAGAAVLRGAPPPAIFILPPAPHRGAISSSSSSSSAIGILRRMPAGASVDAARSVQAPRKGPGSLPVGPGASTRGGPGATRLCTAARSRSKSSSTVAAAAAARPVRACRGAARIDRASGVDRHPRRTPLPTDAAPEPLLRRHAALRSGHGRRAAAVCASLTTPACGYGSWTGRSLKRGRGRAVPCSGRHAHRVLAGRAEVRFEDPGGLRPPGWIPQHVEGGQSTQLHGWYKGRPPCFRRGPVAAAPSVRKMERE
eukprot:scaffold146_cov374-Prasinococcus_capsulatus_cf.AAC.4